MSMTFSADASGTFGTIEINGVPQIIVKNDGSLESPSGDVLVNSEGIVGTVSQSGGVPTGAVIERGSNLNGTYIKFADGTMICHDRLQSSASADITWEYPSPFFATTPDITITAFGVIAYCLYATAGVTSTTLALYTSGLARSNGNFSVTAIGRWY